MKNSLEFWLITYNLQFSLNGEKISDNLVKFARQGITIFCLQEVVAQKNQPFIIDLILKKLGSNWKEIHYLNQNLGNANMGNCIIWDNSKFKLLKTQNLALVPAKAFAIHEWIFAKLVGGNTIPYQRRSIMAEFEYQKFKFRIFNLHLDHIGGISQRMRQLEQVLAGNHHQVKLDYEIFCGDFNNFDLLQTKQETKSTQARFGLEFKHVSADIDWTADLYNIEMANVVWWFKLAIKIFHIHIRRCLDAVWVKGFKSASCKKIELTGSDHFPILTKLNF
ncbi:MAG TPA: hypothetical protein DEP87_03420 [Candidatus Pacebacteria bacterium]|nr:hypothetical protein [Candidatus Paceibacterota bacterium]